MNRFALFMGLWYYPNGGFEDFVRFGETSEACLPTDAETLKYRSGWWQVVDLSDGQIVNSGTTQQAQSATV